MNWAQLAEKFIQDGHEEVAGISDALTHCNESLSSARSESVHAFILL